MNELLQLRNELEESSCWMKDSTTQHPDSIQKLEHDIDGLAKDCGDIYEVFVAIYLKNGNVISLRNKCLESYIEDDYVGDRLYFTYQNEEILFVDFNDSAGMFHQMRIPLSSICFIDQWDKHIDWKSEKRHIIEEIKKRNPGIK